MSERLAFSKLQGAGNDFVLIDARGSADLDWPDWATILCPRRLGVGADGLLVILESAHAPARMRMFNPDGTEDMCGNGLRCVARYLHDRGEIAESGATVEALSGLRKVEAVQAGSVEFRVDMGPPSLDPSSLPANVDVNPAVAIPLEAAGETVAVTLVSMGTPHAVILNHTPLTDDRWREVSRAIEAHPIFPERTTATWVSVRSRGRIRARFFERAVGETLACGTGACAAVVAASLAGLTDRNVLVAMSGGRVRVEWLPDGNVIVTGPAERVFDGVWSAP